MPNRRARTAAVVSRRSVALLAGLAIVALVGVGAVGAVALRIGPAARRRRARRRTSSTRPRPSGVAMTYDGPYPFAVGGGVAVFDCDGDGRPDLYLAGGSAPAALYRNDSPVGGALRFAPVGDPATDLTDVTGAYPIDVDGDGHGRPGGPADRRERPAPRPRRLPVRAGQRALVGSTAATRLTTAFSATWEGRPDPADARRSGTTCALDVDRPDPDHLCADNQLVRPAAAGSRYAAPIPLTPGYCALSMLFSDWDRSGRRDLRVSNDRHYYSDLSDGQEQLWRIAPGEPPRLYTAADGWVADPDLRAWASRSYDLTGDGYPDVYLTSQGDNKLQTLPTGPTEPTYRDIALKRGRQRAHAVHRRRRRCRRRPGIPSSRTSTTTASIDLFVSKGNVDADARLRDAGPEQPVPRPARRHVRRGRRRGRHPQLRPRSRRGAGRLQPRRPARPRRGQPRRPGQALAQRRARRRRAARRRWATGSASGSASRARTATRSAPGSRSRSATSIQRRELTIGGGHVGGQLGWIHVGLGSATGAQVRVQWPDGETGPWLHGHGQPVRRSSSAARPRRRPGSRRQTDGGASRWPGRDSRGSTCRTSGCRTREPGAPGRRSTRPGSAALRERAAARGYDRLVVYADREHSANLAYLTGFDPRFEEAILVVGPAGDPAILVGNECYGHGRRGAAADAPASLPGPQPAGPAARPVAAARRDPRRRGHRPGQPGRRRRLEDVRRPRADRRAGLPRRRAARR